MLKCLYINVTEQNVVNKMQVDRVRTDFPLIYKVYPIIKCSPLTPKQIINLVMFKFNQD